MYLYTKHLFSQYEIGFYYLLLYISFVIRMLYIRINKVFMEDQLIPKIVKQ